MSDPKSRDNAEEAETELKMSEAHFPIPSKPTLHWLTAILRDSGVLPAGKVKAIETIDTGAFNSQTSLLKLTYTKPATESTPTRFALKCNIGEDWARSAGADEVHFYRLAMEAEIPPPAVLRCYAAEYDRPSGESYLLLPDLSDTHKPPISREEQISILHGVPRKEYQLAVIDALAAVHAYWWEHACMGRGDFETGYWSRDKQRFTAYLERRRNAWKRLLDREGEYLPIETRAFYERLFDRLPEYYSGTLAERFAGRQNFTLTHGDTYFCNFLCPRVPGSAATYLIDWQSPSFDMPAYDLVNLLAAFWTREQRNEGGREVELLRRYHETLLASGIGRYTREQLLADYRAGLIFWVLMPVQDGGDGSQRSYWWPKMSCLIDAFQDWGCWALL